jgi:hypothetical protein
VGRMRVAAVKRPKSHLRCSSTCLRKRAALSSARLAMSRLSPLDKPLIGRKGAAPMFLSSKGLGFSGSQALIVAFHVSSS